MTRITVDAELRARLLGFTQALELRDESDRLLARVHPHRDPPCSTPSTEDGWARITVDAAFRAKLADLANPIELCDGCGHVLATVWPHYDPSEYENLGPEISEEELNQRRLSKGKTYTTEEVLAYLAQL
jgi:hypothetical protein